MKKLSNEELLVELEAPFSVDQILWRVTNTANNRTRGQVVPYADPRAYTDRLNALVSPQGWTRSYETVTMNNITRAKRNAEIVTGKILVTCKVTIEGLGTHSGTGEEWADEDNAMTSAEAQAFKRACSCFGLGRYFYDFDAPWVDIDDKSRPKKAPTVPAWMVPENWRKGQRPSGKATTSSQPAALSTGASNGTSTSSHRNGNATLSATSNKARQNGANNGSPKNGVKPEETAAQSQDGSELDKRISALQETVGGSSTAGCCASTAMPTSLTWFGTPSKRRRSSTCWSPRRAACAGWKPCSIACPTDKSAPCWRSCKLHPSMTSPTCLRWSR